MFNQDYLERMFIYKSYYAFHKYINQMKSKSKTLLVIIIFNIPIRIISIEWYTRLVNKHKTWNIINTFFYYMFMYSQESTQMHKHIITLTSNISYNKFFAFPFEIQCLMFDIETRLTRIICIRQTMCNAEIIFYCIIKRTQSLIFICN